MDEGRRASGDPSREGGCPGIALFERVTVAGRSMEPALRDGDWLVVTSLGGPYRVGDIVLAIDPRLPVRLVLKRIAAVDGDRCTLLGDQPEQSTDSRQFGPVPLAGIRGRAIFRYAPIERFGRL